MRLVGVDAVVVSEMESIGGGGGSLGIGRRGFRVCIFTHGFRFGWTRSGLGLVE